LSELVLKREREYTQPKVRFCFNGRIISRENKVKVQLKFPILAWEDALYNPMLLPLPLLKTPDINGACKFQYVPLE
jgi:hypothetical protein